MSTRSKCILYALLIPAFYLVAKILKREDDWLYAIQLWREAWKEDIKHRKMLRERGLPCTNNNLSIMHRLAIDCGNPFGSNEYERKWVDTHLDLYPN